MASTREDKISQLSRSIRLAVETIKGQRARLRRLETEINNEQQRIDDMQRERDALQLAPRGMHVSDHAIVRFLERKLGMDMDAVRHEVLGTDNDSLSLPNGQYPVGDHVIVVDNNTVVTVITKGCE